MGKFTTKYFKMDENDIKEYVVSELDYFADDVDLICEEIGDGNLNYVFKVVDQKSNRSIIVKQAGPVARISSDIKVSPDRNRIESSILKLQYDLAPGLVPKVFKYDSVMNCFTMEDLSDYEIMRTALLKYKQFPHFVDHITTFLVNTLLLTSDVVMDHKEKKERVKNYINPELCEISEDLVFTEPFGDYERNDVFPPSRSFIEENIWGDEALKLETARLKFDFMNHAQSLVHGDLHTGSIFIKENSTMVIDPEFAFYGPAGYDVGNIVANLIFAYVHGKHTTEDEDKERQFSIYLINSIRELVNQFKVKFDKAWADYATDPVAAYQGFKDIYLFNLLKDTAGVAGLELIRRIIGLAHVEDITSISNEDKRLNAEKTCLLIGKSFILSRESLQTGEDFINVIKKVEKQLNGGN